MKKMEREEALQVAVHRLVAYFRPECIYLFGSSARDDSRADSDLDLLVVVPDDTPNRRIWGVYRELADIEFPLDVVPVLRRDFEAQREWLMSLPAIVLREGRLLYNAPPAAA